MTQYEVHGLIGWRLDAAVAAAEGFQLDSEDPSMWRTPQGDIVCIAERGVREGWGYTPSTDWAQGGPIIERERITVRADFSTVVRNEWAAFGAAVGYAEGPTPLIAAMRAYLAAKHGETVELPA